MTCFVGALPAFFFVVWQISKSRETRNRVGVSAAADRGGWGKKRGSWTRKHGQHTLYAAICTSLPASAAAEKRERGRGAVEGLPWGSLLKALYKFFKCHAKNFCPNAPCTKRKRAAKTMQEKEREKEKESQRAERERGTEPSKVSFWALVLSARPSPKWLCFKIVETVA